LLAHPSSKYYKSYNSLIQDLKKYIPDYEKTERYFKRKNIYKYLQENGDRNKAYQNALFTDSNIEDSDSNQSSYTQLYKIFDELFRE